MGRTSLPTLFHSILHAPPLLSINIHALLSKLFLRHFLLQSATPIPTLIYTEAKTQTDAVAVGADDVEKAIAVNNADIVRAAQVRGARPPAAGRASFIVAGSISC